MGLPSFGNRNGKGVAEHHFRTNLLVGLHQHWPNFLRGVPSNFVTVGKPTGLAASLVNDSIKGGSAMLFTTR